MSVGEASVNEVSKHEPSGEVVEVWKVFIVRFVTAGDEHIDIVGPRFDGAWSNE
jgi:hypothetical protein